MEVTGAFRAALEDRYEIVRRIGAGTMATVYLARDIQFNRNVALKVFSPELAAAPGSERLLEVLKLNAHLEHPNLLAVLAVGEANGLVYCVTPFIEGESLRQRLGREKQLPVDETARIATAIASALDYAHDHGVIHSDLKPQNILLRDGQPIVTDLGIASAIADARRTRITRTGIDMGTAYYMSPEQATDTANLDARADVYSLGAVVYEMLTGRPPHAASTTQTVLAKVVTEKPQSIREVRPAVRERMELAISRALEKEPAARWSTAAEFANALHASPMAEESAEVRPVDDNVRFTVFRPKVVRPSTWYRMLAFAHLSEAPAGSNEPDPIETVERQAKAILGEQFSASSRLAQDSAAAIPREGTIMFVPRVDGVEFDPPSQSFRWLGDVHRAEFNLRASAELDGRTATGRLTVYFGAIILADVTLNLRVDSGSSASTTRESVARTTAEPYRRIFASYSHKDAEIVRQYESWASSLGLGDRYLRDVRDLRAGEVWSDAIERMIADANVFQLFWSSNSMHSPHVRREWEYALSLRRADFVRPTYWQNPLPSTDDGRLPPDDLRRLQFHFLRVESPVEALPSLAAPSAPGAMMPPRRPPSPPVAAAPAAHVSSPVSLKRRPRRAFRLAVTLATAAVALIAINGTLTVVRRSQNPGTVGSSTIGEGPKPPVAMTPTVDTLALLAEASRMRSDSLATDLQTLDRRIATLDQPSKRAPAELPALRIQRTAIERQYRNAKAASDSLKRLADSSGRVTRGSAIRR